MPVQLMHFLFSVANSFSVGVSALLALIWLVALVFYVREKMAARRATVKVESFDSALVEEAPARI